MTRNELIKVLLIQLELNGMTFSSENGDPAVTRPVRAEVMCATLTDYMIGAGIVNDQATVLTD